MQVPDVCCAPMARTVLARNDLRNDVCKTGPISVIFTETDKSTGYRTKPDYNFEQGASNIVARTTKLRAEKYVDTVEDTLVFQRVWFE